MSEHLEIKLVINQVDHPRLYSALMAQENPRRRAALLRRLADEGCRPEAGERVHATPVSQASLLDRSPVEQERTDTGIRNDGAMAQRRALAAAIPTTATSPAPRPKHDARGIDSRETQPVPIEHVEAGDDLDYSHLDNDAVNQLFAVFG